MHTITDFLTRILSVESGSGESLSLWHSLLSIAVAYLGGFLSSLTPCVYPMIPITVGVVGGIGSSKKNWHEVSLRGLSYIGGMAVIYSFLGVIAGVSGKVFGSLTNTSSWYISLGILMSLSALVMLDIIPFDPVVWWHQLKRKILLKRGYTAQAVQEAQKEMTLVGAFFLGASSGFIAAPCTTPVLAAILTYIAKTQSVGLGFLLMLAFSCGLGTLLLLVAAFAGAIQILPRSGQWMKSIKIISGLILLAFAEYLIYRAGSFGGS